MPSPKPFLRQLAEQNLNPKKAYTKSDFDKDGKLKQKQAAETEVKVDEVKPEDTLLDSETDKKDQLSDVEKTIASSAAESNSKSHKSTKKETTLVSQKTGETVSVKNTDKKESVKTEPTKGSTDTNE